MKCHFFDFCRFTVNCYQNKTLKILVWTGMTSCRQCLSTSIGGLGRLWSLHPWRKLKASSHGPGQLGWSCLSRGVGSGDLQRSLPNSDSIKSPHGFSILSVLSCHYRQIQSGFILSPNGNASKGKAHIGFPSPGKERVHWKSHWGVIPNPEELMILKE